ncbi:MAG TPA: tRNA (adenosine(37)-N6)-threonylcarbamoyltransferase complex transferase subunit TsaD, partial [Candidatus Paceibacterota bacterium]|nr:tRNA (adenosine(37)-N6)-threonylcarbamoyltransferase complex transferase subunit TsaD [Candidatus Paceibacterota bacterium]
MNILAIETSCDETGIALLEASGTARAPRVRVIENLVTTQIPIHQPFGGVVPNLAKREHLKNLPILFGELRAKHPDLKLDLITVTVGPGLEPALWTGITFAQALAKEYRVPLVGANHLEGHLYSFLLSQKKTGSEGGTGAGAGEAKKLFPAVALIVSGGHTILLKLDSFTKWKRLGETRDDAAGEAFDKVARLLGLPYPGGPQVEALARRGNPHAIAFPRPMLTEKNYDFSFSGLKTSVLYYMRDHGLGKKDPARARADIAASFQEAALGVLIKKTIRAAREAGARTVMLSGGVAANKALRARLQREAKKIGCAFLVPDFKYNLDNGAMIGIA